MVSAVSPSDLSWQSQFASYRLPSPWNQQSHDFSHLRERDRETLKSKLRASLVRIWATAGRDTEQCWCEYLKLLPRAEANYKEGMSLKQAWAAASRDFPELLHARASVNLLLGGVFSTAAEERLLKEVPKQERSDGASSPYVFDILRRYVKKWGAKYKQKKLPKKRRDSNLKRDKEVLKRQRVDRGAPEPLSET